MQSRLYKLAKREHKNLAASSQSARTLNSIPLSVADHPHAVPELVAPGGLVGARACCTERRLLRSNPLRGTGIKIGPYRKNKN